MFTGGPFNGDYITMISSRKIYVWRSTITLFVCALIVVGCSHQSPSELVAEAVSLADIGDNASWREARVKLESAVDNGGDGRPLKLFYAIALERTNDSNAAIAVAKEIQRLAPDTFMPNYLTGKLNYDRGNYQDAVRYLKRAAELDPEHKETLALYGAAAARQNLPDAPEILGRIMQDEDYANNYLLHNEMAIWYVNHSRYNEAMSSFSKAVKLSDGNPAVYLNIAVMYDHHVGKQNLARNYYKRYLDAAGTPGPPTRERVDARLQEISGLHHAHAAPPTNDQ
jgi:tetratricopeptide (TPR) repeat protein